VLGEAQDKFTQTEVDEMDNALKDAHEDAKRGGQASYLKDLLGQLPTTGGLANEADRLETDSNAQEMENLSVQKRPGGFDPLATVTKIYPILEFRDKVMRSIERALESIPGLTALVERISETLSLFILSLLAPYIRPLIAQASLELKLSSTAVIDSSASHQYEPWTDPYCTDPTHSLLSKDHFSHKLNTPAGEVAAAVVTFVVPRVLHAYENPNFPIETVLHDICKVFHHPALRDPNCDIQQGMFNIVTEWTKRLPDRGASLDDILSAEGVRAGKNHSGGVFAGHGHSHDGHGKVHNSEWDKAKKSKKGKKSKEGEYFASLPNIPMGGGGGKGKDFSVGGFQVPGALGGLLAAGVQGFSDATVGGGSGGGGYPGAYPDEKKKKDKYKEDKYKEDKYKEDKYKEDKYKDGKKDKKDKDKKDKDKSKDKKDKDGKKKKKDKDRGYNSEEDSEDEYRSRSKSRERHGHGHSGSHGHHGGGHSGGHADGYYGGGDYGRHY